MKLKSLIITSWTLILISCSEEVELETKNTFFPLEIGNEWTYLVNSETNLKSSSFFYMKVIKDTSIWFSSEHYNAFKVESYLSTRNKQWFVFWSHDNSNNLIQLGAQTNNETLIDKSIQYQNNPNIGDKWDYNSIVYSSYDGFNIEINEIECIQNDSTITTNAGTFSCFVYYDKFKRYEDEDEKRFWFVNPDIGIIKFLLLVDNQIETEYSLDQYKLE